MKYDSNAVYTEGRFQVVLMSYNCHPETCCHWDHPLYCIQRMETTPARWMWWAYADDLKSAKEMVNLACTGE